jgi:biotin operon repressor
MKLQPNLKSLTEPLIQTLKALPKPISGEALAIKLSISQRELRLLVNYVRTNISPHICSSNEGYYYQNDPGLIRQSLLCIKTHAYSQLALVSSMEKLLVEEMR